MATKTVEELQALLDKATAENKTLAKSNESLKEQREQLTEQLKVKEATAGNLLPTVKVDGEHYQFTGPKCRVNKVVTKAEDAAKDEKLCRELIRKNDGWLKKVDITPKAKKEKAEPAK